MLAINHTDDATVVLSSLPKLRRITWQSDFSDVVFQVAATHLGLLISPCKHVEEVMFIAQGSGTYDDSRVKDYCKSIDEVLTSDNFPSLRRVRLDKYIPTDWFPILQSRRLLELTNS